MAAGHGDFRLAETAKQRADEIIGGTDLPGQLIRGAGRADMGAVDLHRVAIDCTDVGTQLFQNLQTQRHIGDLGNIFNAAPSTISAAGMIATAAFFAPLIFTSPNRGEPPCITYFVKSFTLS